jgi:LPXTG-motif cell wall-anchored protein
MRGSNGYLVGQHPITITMGAILLLAATWWFLQRRR